MSTYGGMTVNERLFNTGLLDAFHNCIANSDDHGAVRILTNVELNPEEARAIVAAIRQSPAKFGYPSGSMVRFPAGCNS